MSQNSFLLNPLKCVLWYGGPQKTYVFLGDIPAGVRREISPKSVGPNAKKYYGSLWASRLGHEKITEVIGGDELSMFEELLQPETVAQQTSEELQYVEFPPIFPEDKLSEIKEKIQIATGVPIYRQHLFYVNSSGLQTTYRHTIDGPVSVDIREESTKGLLGLPIDQFMVSRRDSLRTSALDTLRAADSEFDLNHIVYVADLQDYISPIYAQLRERMDDPHVVMTVYWGFVVKYWPMLSKDAFISLILKPKELGNLYPDLAPATPALYARFRAEREIIKRKYDQSAQIEKWAESHIDVSVVQMVAFVPPMAKTIINIRNLFDKLRVSAIIPEIQAWIEVNGARYILRKRHIKNGSDISLPTRGVFREGVCMAISLRKRDQDTFHEKLTHSTAENEQSRYLFLSIHPNGTYYTKTLWNEEDHLELEETIEIMRKFISPIISGINSLGRRVFIQGTRLPDITIDSIKFDTLSVCLFWRKSINETLQKVLRDAWAPYLQARITAPRNVIQPDRYEFTFRKGMYDFDPAHVDRIMATTVIGAENQYAYLANSTVKTKWDQNFDGRVVRMSLRSSDVRFEVINIRQGEFEIFYGFIADFAYHCGQIPAIRDNMANISATSNQKLNRLKEQDPDLFNLKKHGTNRQYSVLCQKPRQPIAYTDDEVKKLPPKELARLTKYYNFTFRRPAYYGCPQRNFPHLAFIVGMHPKNYCLPCCNKKANVAGKFREHIHKNCMETGSFDEKRASGSINHVMAYGKPLDVGRLSRTPPEMAKLLLGEYYLLGVPQTYGQMKSAGILHAVASVLRRTPDDLLSEARKVIGDGASRLLGGRVVEYFGADVFAAMKADTISRELQKFSRMPELLTEIIYWAFGICVFTCIDEFADGRTSFYFSPEQIETSRQAEQYIVVLKSVNRFYPFVEAKGGPADRGKFRGVFRGDEKLIQSIHKCMEYGSRSSVQRMRLLTLPVLRDIVKISRVYVNRQNYVYAAEVDGTYVAVDYSTPDPRDTVVKDYSLKISDGAALASVLSKINSALPREYAPLVPTNRVEYRGKTVGVVAGGMLHRCNDGFADLPASDCGYDVDDVNRTIMAKAAPTPDKTAEISSALWRNYQYQLFLIQFVAFIETERNKIIREKIGAAITSRDFSRELVRFKEELADILRDYPQDLRTILSQLSSHYQSKRKKSLLQESIDQSVYEFDKQSLAKLVDLSDAERYEAIRKLASGFAVENSAFDPSGKEFPNVYLPCIEAAEPYCADKKVIVQNLDEFCRLLSADIADPLRRLAIQNMSWADTIIDPFKFAQNPTEIITVYKVLQ